MDFATFDAAAVPTPYRVLGVALKPFCLGHWMTLRGIESPFPLEGFKATRAQLLIAIMVCSQTFEAGQEMLISGSLKKEIKRWDRIVSRRWLIFNREPNMIDALRMFAEYLSAGLRRPKIWMEGNGGESQIGAPVQLCLHRRLMQLGFTCSEAWNVFLPFAWFSIHAEAEIANGKQVLYSERDMELKRMADEMGKKLNAVRN